MGLIVSPIPPDSQLERIEGGTVLKTAAPRLGLVSLHKNHYLELVDKGSVSNRTYLIRGHFFVAIPGGYAYEAVQVDNSKTFKFEELH